jgi:predicted DNA-binding transcriptional regulator YafY
MNQLDRLYQLERLLVNRQGMSANALLHAMEISHATLKRYLAVLRDRMNVPVVYDRYTNSYAIVQSDRSEAGGGRQELPGVWFSQNEIIALLTMYQLISGLDAAGMLQRHLQPILERLNAMLDSDQMPTQELQRRVRIVGAARREVAGQFFEIVGAALTRRKKLLVTYYTRGRDEESERTLSPQRLVHHRNTWYLDAWCHTTKALKRFSLDAMRKTQILVEPCKEMPLVTVEKAMDEGYGIYAGTKLKWATLVFTPMSATWIAPEQWHPEQKSRILADGSLELKIPYTHETEILMDIQRHGPDVRVVGPADLKTELLSSLKKAVDQYAD